MFWVVVLTVVVLFLVLPIAGIWTWHTQEMAKLRGIRQEGGVSTEEMSQMKKEVIELRQMITSLAINVENMKDNYVHSTALDERMKVGE